MNKGRLKPNPTGLLHAFVEHFMRGAPDWYKYGVIACLLVNPALYHFGGEFTAGWMLLVEFIATLALSLQCYPLIPGGLLAIEAVAIGMTTPEMVYEETHANFPVILLLMFMVAGIHFMREFLAYVFTRILFMTESKPLLGFSFCVAGALLSAWLDALTVVAVMIAVSAAFHDIYTATSRELRVPGTMTPEERLELAEIDLDGFKAFLRNLMMHGAVGSALGGVSTLVGEPQNLLIGHVMGWHFAEFFHKMAPVTIPVIITGLATAVAVERAAIFGYGAPIPPRVRNVLKAHASKRDIEQNTGAKFRLAVQAAAAAWLVIALAFHLAEVGLVGLTVIIALTGFTGKSEESEIGKAFTMALPFTALLIVFFAIVAVINDNALFAPITAWALGFTGKTQLLAFFGATGILSSISDNVFVATVYIHEAKNAFESGAISREQFDLLAVAINAGTNIASVATPNGQAAFLFLLTSSLASKINLSYLRMMILALPYTIVMNITALLCVWLML